MLNKITAFSILKVKYFRVFGYFGVAFILGACQPIHEEDNFFTRQECLKINESLKKEKETSLKVTLTTEENPVKHALSLWRGQTAFVDNHSGIECALTSSYLPPTKHRVARVEFVPSIQKCTTTNNDVLFVYLEQEGRHVKKYTLPKLEKIRILETTEKPYLVEVIVSRTQTYTQNGKVILQVDNKKELKEVVLYLN